MATKTAALPRHEIPLQKDGRTELQELAAALALQVEHRHRTRGAHELAPAVAEPTRYDLTDAGVVPPTPRQPHGKATQVRRAVPLALAATLTAAVAVAGWTSVHPSVSVKTSTHTAAATIPPTPTNTTPTTPAEWGAAAHQRLSQAGRPVDVFGCQAAYAADATVASGALPPAAIQPAIWQAYLSACLSGMSDTRVSRSG